MRVEVGFVAAAHGIRGEIRAVPHDPASATFGHVSAVWIAGRRYRVESARPTPKGFLLALEGLTDRTAAEALKGATVEVDRDELQLEEGDVLLQDLVGCQARLPDGRPWGEVVALDLGPQVRLVIRDGAVERLLPLVDELVPSIDLDARVVTVNPPEDFPEEPVG